MTDAPALTRSFIRGYAPLWLLGAGFLWWPWLLVRLVLRLRSENRPPLLVAAVPFFLGLSLVVAVVGGAPAGRVIGALLNLTVWLSLVLFLADRPSMEQLTALAKGIVDIALFQGVLTILAWWAYPRFQDVQLPVGRLLPASLAEDPSISAFSTTHLAFQDYFAGPVVRSGGVFGNPTWAGALAAVAILLLAVGVGYGGRSRPSQVAAAAGCIALLLPSLALSYSRNTVLALVAGLLAAGAVAVRRHLGPARFHSLAWVAGGVLVAVLALVPLASTLDSVNSARAGSADTRGDIYQLTLNQIAEAPTPVLGSGIKERAPGLVASVGSHSTYLGLVYRGGFLAGLAFVLTLGVAGVVAFLRQDALALGLVVFTLVWCAAEDFDVGHFGPLALALALGRLHAARAVAAPKAVPVGAS